MLKPIGIWQFLEEFGALHCRGVCSSHLKQRAAFSTNQINYDCLMLDLNYNQADLTQNEKENRVDNAQCDRS